MQYRMLSEIAEVQGGLVLSRKEAKADSDSEKYRNLNLRSINADGSINMQLLDQYVAGEKLDEQFITHTDDIVVRLFPPFRPALITETLTGLVVPSQFAIIRPKSNVIHPEFLCCYLAHRNTLEGVAIRESGQVSGGIKISALSEMSIPLPTLEKQNAIAKYCEMNIRRKRLYLELTQQYDLKMDVLISSVIGGA